MKLLITGATGFIGRPLCAELIRDGHELTLLLRRPQGLPADWNLPCQTLIWDPTQSEYPQNLESFQSPKGFDGVINLMGESLVGKPWTDDRKTSIRNSRSLATRRLNAVLAKTGQPLACFISASAVGYYPFDQPEDQTESSRPGAHFLAEVCQDWEAAALTAPANRHVILRFGAVLGANGGEMKQLRPFFAAGIGGRLGSGQQMMSWIHIEDLLHIIRSALTDQTWHGVYNAVSPNPVSNQDFTEILGRTLQRPTICRVPAFMLRKAFGEMSDILLKSQSVIPLRLIQLGFRFRFPQLAEALEDISASQTFNSQQFVPRPLSEVFGFFSDPNNLQRITPPALHFKIEGMNPGTIRTGTTIAYRLRLHGVPFRWRTLIKDWRPLQGFKDTQEKGPYKYWIHTHRFHEVPGGTLIMDEVKYQVPLGWLGETLFSGLVRKEVEKIFVFRSRVLADLYS